MGKTAQEFIQHSFSPLIAVLCSPKVENVVSKNNLSFCELLEPFTCMEWEGQFREPGGTVCIVRNWKLIFRDVNWKPLPPTEARKQLNNAVLYNYNDKTSVTELEGRKLDVPQSTPWFDAWRETYLEVQFPSDHEYTKHFLSCIIVGTTLEENILETFNNLNQQYAQLQNVTPPKLPKWFNSSVLKSYLLLHDVSSVPVDRADAAFETMKQNFGPGNCFMLSINSKTTVDLSLPTDYWAPYIKRTSDINTDNISVSQINMPTSPLEPQTVFPPLGDDNIVMATSINQQETMHPLTAAENDVYDNANSLQTHSFSGSVESVNVISKISDCSTEVHGVGLNTADVVAIKKFLQEYGSKALLPYLEKQIAQLSDVVANRKGVSRSLLSATKRWFGTGKTGNTTASNTVIYSNDCPELQLRRLGDLWFMCGQWQRAFDAYHTAKREFYADSAWLCYAGALEMAAISAFMAGEGNRKTNGYMEESIVTYLTTCRMVQYAVRATLLSVLCLNSASLHGEAAKQLIRMTSEDSDLRSAMLLEQAALCFLSGPGSKAMCRKYAFHMVLAGHRFSKAGQKKHAYRCYKQAYQIYNSSGWRLATDHVQFALGRLAGALKNARDAAKWLSEPLAPNSKQPKHQQHAFLREYMLAHQQWMETSEENKDKLPLLPLPLLESQSTTVLCVGPAPLSSPGRQPATSMTLQDLPTNDGQCWSKLEEMLLQVAQGNVPMIFKPTIDLYTDKTDNNPVVPQGEPIQIAVSLRNPMNISLILKDVELLWQFTPSGDEIDGPKDAVDNEAFVATESTLENNVIYSQKIKSVLLEEDCSKMVAFSITPLRVGQLTIQGVAYKLTNAGEGGTENGNSVTISGKLNLSSGKYNEKRLKINVIPHAPCLQMTFSETSPEAISGEMRSIEVEFRNVGPVDMKNVHIAVSHPDCVCLVTNDKAADDFRALYDDKYRDPPKDCASARDYNVKQNWTLRESTFTDERAERARIWRETASRHVSPAAPSIVRGGYVRARLYLRPKASLPATQLLAYYEPVTSSPRPYRLLRHVFRFTVIDSVEISVVPRRSLRTIKNETSENMNLAVEVKNVSKDKDDNVTVEVLQVSLLSRQWKLNDVTAARTEGPLKSRERLHVVFKSRRISETLPEGHIESSSLNVITSQNYEDINKPPYSKFLTDYISNFDSKETFLQERSTGLIQSMFVVRWKLRNKLKNKDTIGQHCLWLDCFNKTQSQVKQGASTDSLPLQIDDIETRDFLEDKTKTKKDNVVIFKLEYSTNVNHDFNDRKLCLVPITINIVNCYGVPVKVFIDMTKRQNRDTYSEVGWAGALSGGPDAEGKELGLSVCLEKFESRKLNVRAICAAPGTYLLGSAFTLTTTRADDNNPVSHLNNNTSLLVIRQAA